MTPSAFNARLTRRVRLMTEIINSLNGAPFSWGSGEYSSNREMLAELHITVLTRTGLGRVGHRLKRGARPVGYVYFPAPIQRNSPVYIYDVQTVPI